MALPGKAGKQYGLITKAKKSSAPAVLQKPSIFNESSDEEESVTTLEMQKKRQASMQTKIKKQTQLEIQRALEADPTVYEYDSIYDEMERKKEEKIISAKKKIGGTKPKYIQSLLKSAELRKKEQEKRKERQIQKEREKEGEMYGDKEAFVTSAYKKKMQELAEEEERERREAEEEAANDVTKQSDLSGFYRHILSQTAGDVPIKEEKTSEDEDTERKVKEEVERKPIKSERHAGLNIKERDKSGRERHGRAGSSNDDEDYRRSKDRYRRAEKESGHRYNRNDRRNDRQNDRRSEKSGDTLGDSRHEKRSYHDDSSSRHRDDSSNRHRDDSSSRHRDDSSSRHRDDSSSRHRDDSSSHGSNDRRYGDHHRQREDERDRDRQKHEGTGEKRDDTRKDRETSSRRTESKVRDVTDTKNSEKANSSEEVKQPEEGVDAVANPDADSDFEIDSEESDTEEGQVKPVLEKPEAISKEDMKKRKEEEEESRSKFVKRTGNETVMSARDRYLARKAARDTTKAHVTEDNN